MSAPTPPPVAPQGSARGKNPMVNLSITDKFITVARGTGGVDELAMFLDESLVMWGLVKVVVGSGAMARSKFVFLYFSGAGMSTVKRMRFTERRPGAVAALGGGMIDWDREHVKDVTLDTLLEKVLSAVVADDGGADMSVSAMREQALAQIKAAEEALKRKPALKRGVSQGGRSGRVSQGGGKTALALRAELGFKDVLDMVRNPKGGLNWILVTPTLKLIEAGGGSVPEMRRFLPESDVAFALVRMGFGAGQFRRNNFLFVHWAGEKCPHVQRGKANAEKPTVQSALKCDRLLEMFAQDLDDLTLEDCIEKMKKYLVIDGDEAGEISVASFEEALKEDKSALVAEFGEDAGDDDEGLEGILDEPDELPVAEAVASVRADEEPFNWVLIGPRP